MRWRKCRGRARAESGERLHRLQWAVFGLVFDLSAEIFHVDEPIADVMVADVMVMLHVMVMLVRCVVALETHKTQVRRVVAMETHQWTAPARR